MCYNYLIKNTDAHCKNFSLLYVPTQDGYTLQLSPLYDLNSMHIYNVEPIMAMSYGDELNYYKIRWEQFALLSDQLKVDREWMHKILFDMSDVIVDAASDVARLHKQLYNSAPCYDSLVRRINKAATNLQQFLRNDSEPD